MLPGGSARAAAAQSAFRSSVISTRGMSSLRRAALRSSALRPKCWVASFEGMSIAENLADILARIQAARKAAIKPAASTQLVAVSKTVPQDGIREALTAGQRLFGENRVQEAQGKYPVLKAEFRDLELHLIGHLQTNKVKEAVALFDVIQTLDRPKLADALAQERDK